MQIPEWWRMAWLTNASCVLLISWACLIFAIRLWRRRLLQETRNKLPPGPLPLPVLGNLLHVMGDLPHVRLARLAQRYGPLMYLRMGWSTPMVVASSADVAREFLQRHDRAFASRPPSLFMEHVQYGQAHGLVLAQYGPHWRHVRKVAALQLFSSRRVQDTQPLRREELARLLHSLADAADAAASAVDLTHSLSSMIEDLLCRMIFRRRVSDMVHATAGDGGVALKDLFHRSTALLQVPLVGDFIPWLGFLDRGVLRTMDKLHQEFDALWEFLIAERERQHQLNTLHGRENVPEDILDELLLDPSFSRVVVKQYIMDLIGAGTDTTSVTLDWIMAELFNNPSVLKKLQAEIGKVVGLDRMVEDSDVAKLPYVAATVKETLRLHAPPSLLLPHMSTEACEVMGYDLPEGTRLLVNAWAIGRDPSRWEDPERFWPERFILTLGSDDDDRDPTLQFSWIPFGSGRRSCPGAPLALPTLELTVANLVHCFDWQLPHGQSHVDMSEKTSVVVCRKEPLPALPLSCRPAHAWQLFTALPSAGQVGQEALHRGRVIFP